MPIFAPLAMMTAFYVDVTLESTTSSKVEKFFLWILGLFPLAVGAAARPLYFHFAEEDLRQGPHAVPLTIIVLSAVAIGWSLVALWFLFRGKVKYFWVSYGVTMFSLLVLILTTLVPLVDRYRSVAPFCGKVKTIVGKDSPLYALLPDESLRGAIPFYTGRYIDEVYSMERVGEILGKGDRVFFVERDTGGALEKLLLATGKLSVVIRNDMGSERSLLLLTNS